MELSLKSKRTTLKTAQKYCATDITLDVAVQDKSVTPKTKIQEVFPDNNYVGLSSVIIDPVTSDIDSNISAENIKKDVTILGITGTLESGSNGTPIDVATEEAMASILSNATADDNGKIYRYTGTTGTYINGRLYKVVQATSNEYTFEELITPVGSTTKTENGTYEIKEYAEVVVNVPIGITPIGKKEITNTSEVDVTNYATAQVVDNDLIASNIRKGVNILGVTGTLQEGITPSGTLNITANGTYNVTNYASANVNVPIPEGYVKPSGSVTITENGTQDVTDKKTVVVNVPSVIEVATADEMTALLVEANVGKVYRFVGTTDGTYTNGDLYEVVSE